MLRVLEVAKHENLCKSGSKSIGKVERKQGQRSSSGVAGKVAKNSSVCLLSPCQAECPCTVTKWACLLQIFTHLRIVAYSPTFTFTFLFTIKFLSPAHLKLSYARCKL